MLQRYPATIFSIVVFNTFTNMSLSHIKYISITHVEKYVKKIPTEGDIKTICL
jgi:hypothetical protein